MELLSRIFETGEIIGMLRIDKYLADCGIGTRSEVKKYIKAKQITVNGEVVGKPEQKIDENSDVI